MRRAAESGSPRGLPRFKTGDRTSLRELLPTSLKAFLKGLLRLPDRLLHPLRRRRARERLERVSSGADSVLFVCYGNICRSPFAERLFATDLAEGDSGRPSVESTGFHAEKDRPSPPEAVASAERFGVDLSDHRSRSLAGSSDRLIDAEGTVVFVMDEGQAGRVRRLTGIGGNRIFVLGDFDPDRIVRRGIRDPYGQRPEVFDDVFARIRRCVGAAERIWNASRR